MEVEAVRILYWDFSMDDTDEEAAILGIIAFPDSTCKDIENNGNAKGGETGGRGGRAPKARSVCSGTNKENRYCRGETSVASTLRRKRRRREGVREKGCGGVFWRRRDIGICMRLGRILTTILIILWLSFETVNSCLNRLIAVEKPTVEWAIRRGRGRYVSCLARISMFI